MTLRNMRQRRRTWRWPSLRQHPRLNRLAAGLLAVTMLGAGLTAAGRAPEAAGAGAAFTRTIVIARNHLNEDGSQSSVDPKTFSVSVDNITGLRNQQPIRVSWSGAHPTGGIVSDINGVTAQDQEYPVVLMECRGIDSSSAPVGQRVDPTTCWTQTPNGRFDQNSRSFPAWRVDRYAPVAERAARVNAPADPCPGSAGANAVRYTPFVALTPTSANPLATTTYLEGPSNCGNGMSPDGSNDVVAGSLPPNTTYGITRPDGTGDASFVVWTDQQNGSLGCSTTVPCTLEIIPIEGISCDPSGAALPPGDRADRPNPGPETETAKADCETAGKYKPGEPAVQGTAGELAVSGELWWSASNWRNRIAVPLNFATPGNFCDILDTRLPVDIYGSELMSEAADQWSVEFCQDPKRFKFRHVRTSEPLAKTALSSGSISAAFESQPPPGGYSGPTVNAPVAVTGFAISYAIDDAKGYPYRNLRLNPRLLAKLLTESYWSMPALHEDFAGLPASNPYHAMATNPQNITTDPEFRALNPDVGDLVDVDSMAMLQTLSGDTDVLYALSTYIGTDPEAAAFIAGKPDPWGMVVNPSYRNLGLPLDYWPLQDTYLSSDITMSGCFQTENGVVVNQVPILSLVSAPKTTLSDIALDMEYALPSSTTNCVATTDPGGTIIGRSLKPQPKPQVGHRFVIGVTSVADAEQYNLDTAALQSYATHPSTTAKFTGASGRSFVTPNDTSMRFAMQLAGADDTTHTWPIPYARLRTQQGQFAYPGTMVVYAAVPTQGLDSTTARRLAQLLRFAAVEGQVPGLDNGQLPSGYLPMTAANGLEPLSAYAQRAADAVEAQQGDVPLINQPAALPNPPASAAPPQAAPGEPSASPTPEFSPWTPGLAAMAFTHSAESSLAGWALPGVVLIFFAGLLTAGVARARISATMVSSIEARLVRLAAMRRNGNGGTGKAGTGKGGGAAAGSCAGADEAAGADKGADIGKGAAASGAGKDAGDDAGEGGNPDAARSGK